MSKNQKLVMKITVVSVRSIISITAVVVAVVAVVVARVVVAVARVVVMKVDTENLVTKLLLVSIILTGLLEELLQELLAVLLNLLLIPLLLPRIIMETPLESFQPSMITMETRLDKLQVIIIIIKLL